MSLDLEGLDPNDPKVMAGLAALASMFAPRGSAGDDLLEDPEVAFVTQFAEQLTAAACRRHGQNVMPLTVPQRSPRPTRRAMLQTSTAVVVPLVP